MLYKHLAIIHDCIKERRYIMANPNKDSVDHAKDQALRQRKGGQAKQMILWFAALIVGAILGWLQVPALNELFNFVATVFTRLFQFIAVPTIALAVITTLSALGAKKDTGRIFAHAVTYTLLTTIAAASIGLILYLWIAPGNLPADLIGAGTSDVPMQKLGSLSYYDHFLSVIPNNMLQPFLAGNVLSVMLIAASVGLALAFMPKTENRAVLLKGIHGLQELLFTLIRALLWALPAGILAFAVALFTKSSAGTLPVTLASAEARLKVNPRVSRFVLPICTTINMNGCAAFILVTSLFVMQNAGFDLSIGTMITWLFVAVLAAIGNAGVPMGCYFLTLSLMSSLGAPLGLMGVILPIYTIIDMIETPENLWSDTAVGAKTAQHLHDNLADTRRDTRDIAI